MISDPMAIAAARELQFFHLTAVLLYLLLSSLSLLLLLLGGVVVAAVVLVSFEHQEFNNITQRRGKVHAGSKKTQ